MNTRYRHYARLSLVLVLLPPLLIGCGPQQERPQVPDNRVIEQQESPENSQTPETETLATNNAPTISGTPATVANVGELYQFQAQVDDTDGDSLRVEILNPPAWANFNSDTGLLSGTPGSNDIGTVANNIIISVTDNAVSVALAAFSITVNGTVAVPSITDQVVYVDNTIGVNSCSNYSVSSRLCANGEEQAYGNFNSVIAAAGDTVFIRGGTYNEALVVKQSGAEDNYLTFTNYDAEDVILTGNLRPAIDISRQQYVIIDGLTVTDVLRWLYVQSGHHNIIRNNTFRRATDGSGGSKTGLFFTEATHNKILNNIFDDNAADAISFVASDYNLMEGNHMTRAVHALWDIRCGHFNVIRNNYFHNAIQKIGEVYDCAGVAGYTSFNDTKRNLIDSNDFAYVPSSGNSSPYSGIQYAGQQGIIRRNRFYDTTGPGIRLTIYGNEAQNNTENRVYHNVFYGSSYAGIKIPGGTGGNFSDNIIKNNILAKSVFVANDTRWSFYTGVLAGQPVQFKIGRLLGVEFDNNNVYHEGNSEQYLIVYGDRDTNSHVANNVVGWDAANPDIFKNNMELAPGFENENDRNFQLTANSPMIDAGGFLTKATSNGSGYVLPVADASYFYDGFGIDGELGDEIQLDGQTITARVVDINYADNTVTLDQALTWSNQQGVSLKYNGIAPDVGAYERD